jgi:hypothetical protein
VLDATLNLRHVGARRVRIAWECVGPAGAPLLIVQGGISATRHCCASRAHPEAGLVGRTSRSRQGARQRAFSPPVDRLARRGRHARCHARSARSGRCLGCRAGRTWHRACGRVRGRLLRRHGRAAIRGPVIHGVWPDWSRSAARIARIPRPRPCA